MDRLTKAKTWDEAYNNLANEMGYSYVWTRLSEIENILGDEYDLEKLSELLKAKSEGRLFVLDDSEFECDVKEKAYRYAFALSIFFENDVNDYIYDAVLEKFKKERTEQELEELKNNGLQ